MDHIPDYYTSSFGQVDLNDPATYKGLHYEHYDADRLRGEVESSVGRSLYYMLCIQPEFVAQDQYQRVLAFGKHFWRESREPDRRDNAHWLRKQLFLIEDETENQC